MENESFENDYIAKILNESFISIKVDKEERPDIDNIYMRVCQAYTGSGGWPTSIFMTSKQKPFYAGTYFSQNDFIFLLNNIKTNWVQNREKLLQDSESIIHILNKKYNIKTKDNKSLINTAYNIFLKSFDYKYGGFNAAPKFPSPHNLLFLMKYSKYTKENHAMKMVEKTLLQMYKGGIFDHIGYGFSRYSVDNKWLIPHFEKMLYDNALLIITYTTAYEQTKNHLYKEIAEKIFVYIKREMTGIQGGFYTAQDADSDNIEGKYYSLTPKEIINILGNEDGILFNEIYDITSSGNYEGKSIPNLIKFSSNINIDKHIYSKLYNYRRQRTSLHLDNKILTLNNSLMLWAVSNAYRVFSNDKYLKIVEKTFAFIEKNLIINDTCFVGITNNKHIGKGFLDDYAFYILALIQAYESTFDDKYLTRALVLTKKVISDFYDTEFGGFYFNANDGEKLIFRSKEIFDGAIPSGNSVMAFNLDRLYKLTKNEYLYDFLIHQQAFMNNNSTEYPAGFCFYLISTFPTRDIVCVLKNENEFINIKADSDTIIRILKSPTKEYPLLNNQTTFYVCENNHCNAPTNKLKSSLT